MSALMFLIVVVAVVPYTLELQLESNVDDVIALLNHAERIKTKNKIINNPTERDVNYKKVLKSVFKKAAKMLHNEEKNRLDYYNQIHLGTEDNQPLKIHNDDREANNAEFLNQYLSVKPPWLKSRGMKRKPNYQLDRGHGGNNLYEDARNNDRTGYSKIYLVLNPEANLEKSDVRDISNLVSSMFSKTNINQKSSTGDRLEKLHKELRDHRRRIRESNEDFPLKESMEHERKPKRGRNEYSGARGRTGIPYVRHRGDVYERD